MHARGACTKRETVMAGKALVGYVRVSKSQQGRSGLGLDAQKQALGRFAETEGFTLARVFVEVETGKGSDALERRPQLAAALSEARRHRCSVAVAKWQQRLFATRLRCCRQRRTLWRESRGWD
jgi:DNA invertase Pin-like site-specific DNA recombinase